MLGKYIWLSLREFFKIGLKEEEEEEEEKKQIDYKDRSKLSRSKKSDTLLCFTQAIFFCPDLST